MHRNVQDWLIGPALNRARAERRWSGKRLAYPLFVIVAASGLTVSGCESIDGAQVLRNTIEGLARGACRSAGNCSNRCPDGGEARGPLYRCPSADGLRRP